MKPKISVVMPVYNVERYVAAAIESVLAQTWTNYELLIIIDGATDNSLNICRKYGDPRIRIIEQANRGLAGARNTGIRHARGEYIAFIDSDDLWLPQKLALQAQHLEQNPDLGVSYCGSEFIDDDGNSLGLFMCPQLHDIHPQDVYCRNPVGNGSVPMIRKKVFGDIAFRHHIHGDSETGYFDESYRQSEDIECWMRIALLTSWRFEGIDACLVKYRVNTGGLSANLDKQYYQWQRMADKIRDYAPAFAERWESRARAYQLRYLARRAVRMRSGPIALKLMLKAIFTAPSLLWKEPGKTTSSLAAAGLLFMLPLSRYEALEAYAISKTQHKPTSPQHRA